MSTTVVRQRTTRFPGKGIGMSLAGLAIAAAIGFGIANIDNSVPQTAAVGSAVHTADQVFLNQAAELASERQSLLNQATKGVGGVVVPKVEFGGMAAPTWQPNWGAVEPADIDTGGVNNTEPFGYPNYGRLENYLGAEPTSGPR